MAMFATRLKRRDKGGGFTALTFGQIRAMRDLYESAGPADRTRWRKPDNLDSAYASSRSSLIKFGLVEGKEVRAARRTERVRGCGSWGSGPTT